MEPPYSYSSFPGPSAPWVDDEEVTKDHQIRMAADELVRHLRARIDRLTRTDVSMDDVVNEMRRQMAAGVVDGNLGRVTDLTERAWDLLQQR